MSIPLWGILLGGLLVALFVTVLTTRKGKGVSSTQITTFATPPTTETAVPQTAANTPPARKTNWPNTIITASLVVLVICLLGGALAAWWYWDEIVTNAKDLAQHAITIAIAAGVLLVLALASFGGSKARKQLYGWSMILGGFGLILFGFRVGWNAHLAAKLLEKISLMEYEPTTLLWLGQGLVMLSAVFVAGLIQVGVWKRAGVKNADWTDPTRQVGYTFLLVLALLILIVLALSPWEDLTAEFRVSPKTAAVPKPKKEANNQAAQPFVGCRGLDNPTKKHTLLSGEIGVPRCYSITGTFNQRRLISHPARENGQAGYTCELAPAGNEVPAAIRQTPEVAKLLQNGPNGQPWALWSVLLTEPRNDFSSWFFPHTGQGSFFAENGLDTEVKVHCWSNHEF